MAKAKTSESVITEALDKFSESEDGSETNRTAAYEDIRFSRLGEQWPDKVKQQREQEGRPILTINKLPAFIRQVVNDARQNKPAIKVAPVDGGADVDTAEVISGLIKSIERGSNAEIAYDTAIDHAVTGGFGFFRIGIDYAHEDSFDLEARIERIPNPLMVHWDISSTQFDASDWGYAFISEFVTKKEFEKRYPKANPVSFEGDSRDSTIEYWYDDDRVRLAEYWSRTECKRDLIMLSNGEAVRADRLPVLGRNMLEAGGMSVDGISDDELAQAFMQLNGVQETRRREATYHEVVRRIISGVEVLEEDPWPGSTIPICPVWGEEVYLDGKRHFRSMIRDAKDPQAMFNFWRSATTELVALSPRAPFIGPKGFVPKGHEGKWQTANSRSHAYLEYDQSAGGPPQRQPFAGPPAGALQEALNASDDIKAITGIYDASLGQRSNETSGRAIMARQKEGDNANFHFVDNQARAIRYAGRCLVEIIPAIYGPRQTVRILGDDMKEKVIRLTTEGGPAEPGIDGEQRLHNLAVGKYDVTVSTGPSYATQREETRETLVELMSRVPDAAPILGDVLLEHLDFAGSDKIAKRLKALLPAQVQQAEGLAPPQQPQGPSAEEEYRKRQLDIQAYDAETKRISAMSAGISPEQVHALVMQTIQQVMASTDILPGQPAEMPGAPMGAPAMPPG